MNSRKHFIWGPTIYPARSWAVLSARNLWMSGRITQTSMNMKDSFYSHSKQQRDAPREKLSFLLEWNNLKCGWFWFLLGWGGPGQDLHGWNFPVSVDRGSPGVSTVFTNRDRGKEGRSEAPKLSVIKHQKRIKLFVLERYWIIPTYLEMKNMLLSSSWYI